MSIYLDEKNPGKHKPFDDASQDIVEYVRYLEVIAGKSANTAFSYYCDLRGFSRFMKRRRGLVPDDSEMKDIDPKGLEAQINQIAGVVANGLFAIRPADLLLLGTAEGVKTKTIS